MAYYYYVLREWFSQVSVGIRSWIRLRNKKLVCLHWPALRDHHTINWVHFDGMNDISYAFQAAGVVISNVNSRCWSMLITFHVFRPESGPIKAFWSVQAVIVASSCRIFNRLSRRTEQMNGWMNRVNNRTCLAFIIIMAIICVVLPLIICTETDQ